MRSANGLTAETVIGALEDAEDYKAFEAAIIADYDVQSVVERELVLRLTSLLWRLRRATTMETGLFEIQADYLREFRQSHQTQPKSQVSTMQGSGGLILLMPTPIDHPTRSRGRITRRPFRGENAGAELDASCRHGMGLSTVCWAKTPGPPLPNN